MPGKVTNVQIHLAVFVFGVNAFHISTEQINIVPGI